MSKTSAAMVALALPALSAGFLDAEPRRLKEKQSKLKGLLVQPLANGEHAGIASQMNATATPSGDGSDPLSVNFNQDVGEMMTDALREVMKFLYVRHDEIPSGYVVDIAFEDRYTSKDGPSAATACALMLDSLITGDAIDPKFAVTGDMNADGSVQPVGGVPAKVRGARAKDCELVAIPAKNARSLADLVLTEGVVPVTRIQVFTIADFDSAKALAAAEKTGDLKAAIEGFAMVQGAVAKHKQRVLANPKVQAKLREVIAKAPNHLSARLLLDKATGRAPRTLSLGGSLESIEKSTASLLEAARVGGARRGPLAPDDLATALGELRRVRGMLDRRTWKYADSIQDFGTLVRDFQNAPPRGANAQRKKLIAIQEAAEHIDAEVRKIRNNKEMMEELMR